MDFHRRIFLGAYGRKCKFNWLFVRKNKMRRGDSRLGNRTSWTALNSTSRLRTQWKSTFSLLRANQAVVMKTKIVRGRGRGGEFSGMKTFSVFAISDWGLFGGRLKFLWQILLGWKSLEWIFFRVLYAKNFGGIRSGFFDDFFGPVVV